MKRLYLMRHAKSSKDIPGIKDKERPLNTLGKREAHYMAKRLKKDGIIVQAVYSSPAKRALDTVWCIAKGIGFPRHKIEVMNALYDANITKLMKTIKRIDDTAGSALICGHNPAFFKLINYLTPRPIKDFPTAGVFGIDFNIDSWRKAARNKGVIAFFECPKEG